MQEPPFKTNTLTSFTVVFLGKLRMTEFLFYKMRKRKGIRLVSSTNQNGIITPLVCQPISETFASYCHIRGSKRPDWADWKLCCRHLIVAVIVGSEFKVINTPVVKGCFIHDVNSDGLVSVTAKGTC